MNNMLKWTAIAFVILPFLDARIVTQQGRSYSRFFRREVPQEHSHVAPSALILILQIMKSKLAHKKSY
jgi:hypothetical protein